MAAFYYDEGADELVFYDITASYERRNIMIETVRKVLRGFSSLFPWRRHPNRGRYELVLLAERKSEHQFAAIREPDLIAKGQRLSQPAIVLGMDVKRVPPPNSSSGYEW